MTRTSTMTVAFLCGLALVLAAPSPAGGEDVSATVSQPPITYPDFPSETPTVFEPVTGDFDYDRRVVMIPMRDGVRLHTVILVPKGADGAPIAADQPLLYRFALPTANHVFLPGHRIMVQIQSSWFPLYDRNPQTFVPSIFWAEPEDFRKATQRIYHAPGRESFVELPMVVAREN